MWERLIYNPWVDFMEKEERRRQAYAAFRKQREKVRRGDAPDLTMEEIDAEIALARAERYAKESRS